MKKNKETFFCIKHKLNHGQKYLSCVPSKKKKHTCTPRIKEQPKYLKIIGKLWKWWEKMSDDERQYYWNRTFKTRYWLWGEMTDEQLIKIFIKSMNKK